MKTLIKYLKYIVAGMILPVTFSCSDAFLDDVSNGYLTTPLGEISVSPEWGDVEYTLYCPVASASFTISDIPQWLEISPTSGQFIDGVAFVTCRASVNSEFDKYEIYNVMITVTIDGYGKYYLPVFYINEGTPNLVTADSLELTYSQDEYHYLDISNNGDGILMYNVEEYPEWLIVRADNFPMPPHSRTEFIVGINTEYYMPDEIVAKGKIEGNIVISSNDRKHSKRVIKVVCNFAGNTGNDANITAIAGTVSDAWFDKSTDRLYIATQQPNRLWVYDTKTKSTAHEIILSYAPTCFKMSEDRSKIAVGHEGKISFVDVSNNEVEKTVEVKTVVFDIEWGTDNWCCYTPGYTFQGYCGLKWINAITDEQDETSDRGIRGGTIIKKIPNHDYIIATYSFSTFVYDSQKREYVKDVNESLTDPFWFTEQGDYLFESEGDVYRTSLLITDTEISPVAQLKLDGYKIGSLDHNPATNSLWTLYEYGNTIWQLETNDYTLVQPLSYYEYYPTVINGFYAEYPVEGRYIFSNSAGDEIFVIKNVWDSNVWLMEYISL
jgi:hypothetical protein